MQHKQEKIQFNENEIGHLIASPLIPLLDETGLPGYTPFPPEADPGFPIGGCLTKCFPKNCMERKELERGRGVIRCVPSAPFGSAKCPLQLDET